MERKEVEKAVRKISVFVLWLVALLAAIAVGTVAVGVACECWMTTTWGLLLFLLPLFAVMLYRRIVVKYVREVVER